MLSYGENVEIDFTRSTVIQLIGANGAGKSSIPVILEETLFNKNSRGVKKSDILNRYSDKKLYSSEVIFDVDGTIYQLNKEVKTSAKVVLLKDGVDISGHTATQTYKQIEAILQVDFSTFSKLVYQSMVSSLDFLTATDTNRKKFLVSLFSLEKYERIEAQFKEESKDAKTTVATINGGLKTVESWIKANSNVPEEIRSVEVPASNNDLDADLLSSTVRQREAESINARVRRAKVSREAFERVEAKEPKEMGADLRLELQESTSKHAVVEANKAILKREYTKLKSVTDTCPTCKSKIDISDTLARQKEIQEEFIPLKIQADELLKQIEEIKPACEHYKTYNNWRIEFDKAKAALIEEEDLEGVDLDSLNILVEDLKSRILISQNAVRKAEQHNQRAEVTNAKRTQILEQLESHGAELVKLQASLLEATAVLADLEVIAKAFGSKGLIAYKIESMVKVFEDMINEYLGKLSSGRFALGFEVDSSKLNIVLYDNSNLIDIKSLSSGELNRVNTATLLAVRKLMASFSKTHINLLFLDEITSVLDMEGKEVLMEVLLEEKNLVSLIVSHQWSHPLIDKLAIIKEGNISRIDEWQ